MLSWLGYRMQTIPRWAYIVSTISAVLSLIAYIPLSRDNLEPSSATDMPEFGSVELAEQYFSVAGEQPELYPKCNGMMSLCLGDNLSRAHRAFGPSDTEFAGEDPTKTIHLWSLRNRLQLMLEVNERNIIGSVTTTVLDGAPPDQVRVNLPENIWASAQSQVALGEVTFGELEDLSGPNVTHLSRDVIEDVAMVDYGWQLRPEGSAVAEFGADVTDTIGQNRLRSLSDAQVIRRLRRQEVTSATIRYYSTW